jgi:hypothetical protein
MIKLNKSIGSLFGYDSMKVIHKHESIIRSDVVKNQQMFCLFIKNSTTTFEFDNLIDNEELEKRSFDFP